MALLAHPLSESDASLIARVLDCDADAFDALFERYFDSIHAHVAKSTLDRGDVELRVEQVWSAALSSLEDFSAADTAFAAWLKNVADAVLGRG